MPRTSRSTFLSAQHRSMNVELNVRGRGSPALGRFFQWYNHEHRHGGIGLMPPAAIHDGSAVALTAQRTVTLAAAFIAHPLRFKGVAPKPPTLPTAAWINPPKPDSHVLNAEAQTSSNIQSEGIPQPKGHPPIAAPGRSYAVDFQ